MRQASSEEVSALRELDLGRHTLLVMSDKSISLLANDEEMYHADNVTALDCEETYRLLAELQTLFQ